MAQKKQEIAVEEWNKKLNENIKGEGKKINYPIRMLLLWWALQFYEMGIIKLSSNSAVCVFRRSVQVRVSIKQRHLEGENSKNLITKKARKSTWKTY